MTTPVRFHLDESADGRVAKGLRARDRDCSIPKEVGLIGATDPEHLEFAIKEDRVMITRDSDFAALHKENPNHPGIVFWQSDDYLGVIVTKLDEMATNMTAAEFRGQVFYL